MITASISEKKALQSYESIYSSHVSNDLWPKINDIIITLELTHLFTPYQGLHNEWYFKIAGSLRKINEFCEDFEIIKDKALFDKEQTEMELSSETTLKSTVYFVINYIFVMACLYLIFHHDFSILVLFSAGVTLIFSMFYYKIFM
jgi:hypothetical protein